MKMYSVNSRAACRQFPELARALERAPQGQSLPLLTLCSSVLGVVQSLWSRQWKDRAAGHWGL